MENMKFKEIKIEDIKNKDFNIIVNNSRRKEILEEIGYKVNEKGSLIDKETSKIVLAEDGKSININKDEQFALVSGSHNFVRNVAGYSQVITNKGLLRIYSKEART